MIKVTKTSPFTGNTHTLEIPCTVEQLERWKSGEGLIQNIMPDVPSELREFLMTGITPEEWDKFSGQRIADLFGDVDELDYDQEVELPSDSSVFRKDDEPKPVFDIPGKLLEFDENKGYFVPESSNE